jgi:hypothetical protein
MHIVRAATANFVFSNLAFRESIGLFGYEDTTGDADASPNEAHNYLHDLLEEFIAAGGTVTEA